MLPAPLIQALPFAIIILAYIAGMFIDIMEVDAAQYASMATEMAESGDFLHLWDKGFAYLDKPPMVFWTSALSFKIFGISTFSYKLPSVLFSLLAVFSVWRLGSFLYDRRTGYIAAVVLASCQAFFLMNHDVKTDMFLVGAVSLAVWQLVVYARGGKWWNLQLGFAAMGIAMLSKGPIGVVAPAIALGTDFMLRRDWKGLFNWKWLLGIPVFLLLQVPFCIGLYDQHGWEGIEFYFWTQSFGRITGDSEWVNDASVFFFVHNFAWSFLPWTLAAVLAFGKKAYRIVRDGFYLPTNSEAVSWAGFFLVFVALSLSRFKLPHYIFLTYPFAAILVAEMVNEWVDSARWKTWANVLTWVHFGVIVLGIVLIFVLSFWAFPGMHVLWILLGIGGGAGLIYLFFQQKDALIRMLIVPAAGFALCNFLLNAHLYPSLTPYQSTAAAGKYMAQQQFPPDRVFAYNKSGRAIDFYYGHRMEWIHRMTEIDTLTASSPIILFTSKVGIEHLNRSKFDYEIVQEYDDFRIARLSLPFINPSTRQKQLAKRYLLRIKGRKNP